MIKGSAKESEKKIDRERKREDIFHFF